MSKKVRLLAVAAAVAAAVIAAQAPAASAWDCTPGYWKNHTSVWPGTVTSKNGVTMNLSPSTRVGDVFPGAKVTADWTLLQALQGGGGQGTAGAEIILVRAATARLMNAAIDHEKAALDRIPADTSAAIASGDRPTMIALGGRYDVLNNGVCRSDHVCIS
jgi:hypothetical protein